MRQQSRRNVGVVLQQIPLGDSLFRPKDLLEIGELEFAPVDLKLGVVLVGRN
jgi:hypothetical protein